MDRLRLKAAFILTAITGPASYLMQVFLGVYYERNLPEVLGKLKVFNIIVVALLVGANLLLWRTLAPIARAQAAALEGKGLSDAERTKARGASARAVNAILGVIIVAYVIGPIAGIVANTAAGISSYDAADIVFILLINVSIGAMTGTHCVLLIENLLRAPLETLGLRAIDSSDAYVSLRGRIILASVSSLVFVATLFAAAGYGYLQAFAGGAEAAAYAPRYWLETGVLAIFGIAWGVWLSYTIATGLTFRLKSMTLRISSLAEGDGDLRIRANIVRNDDIGSMAAAFNRFLDELEALVVKTKTLAGDARSSADALASSAGQAKRSVETLEGSLETVRKSAESQNGVVASAKQRIEDIATSADAVADRVSSQAAFVEQSSAAVSQMAANIAGVSRTAGKADEVAADLKVLSEEGGATLKDSVAAIRELETVSRSVGAIVSSISKIAAQTNLLAMNAAIEAAHAGAAGAGFAVVADEVRSLAESASRSAKEIVGLIKDMTSRIVKGVALADRAGASFDRIKAGVDGTSELVRTIAAAMGEQKEGAEEILRSVNSLTDATEAIRSLAEGQRGKSREMRSAMDSIVTASDDILATIEKEAGSTSILARVVGVVSEEAVRNTKSTESLSSAVARFKTRTSG